MAFDLAIFVASIIFIYVMYQISNRKLVRAVDQFPGPLSLPFLGNTWTLWKFEFEQIKLVTELRKEYGPRFRFWVGPRPFIILSRPEDVEVVLSNMKNITKGSPYQYLEPWLGDGLLVSTGAKWQARRKLLTPTFHFKILDEFLDIFDRNGEILQGQLAKYADSGKAVDVFGPISLCALDNICETAMGSGVDAQLSASSSYVKAVKDACKSLFLRTLMAWLHFEVIFRMSEIGKLFYKAVDTLHEKTNQVIQARKNERAKNNRKMSVQEDDFGVKKRKAFLDQLLDSKENGAALTDQDIREEVDTFMFEGHDTTTASISFTVYSLAVNPDIQEKAFEEQKVIFGDSDRAATGQDVAEMKYLDRVIKESLRLYPSVPLFLRTVTSDIELSDGKVVPAGSSVGISALCMGRFPDIWPNPEIFDPDRFLPEACAQRHPFAYTPFSAGPRNCIGQKFAMLEMKTTVSKIIRKYRLLPGRPASEPINVVGEVILKCKDGLPVRFERRVY